MHPYPDFSGVTPNKLGDAKRRLTGIDLILRTAAQRGAGIPTQAITDVRDATLGVLNMLEDLQGWCLRVEARVHALEDQRSQQPDH